MLDHDDDDDGDSNDDDDEGNDSDEFRAAARRVDSIDSGHTQHAISIRPWRCSSSSFFAEMRLRECGGEREEDRGNDDDDDDGDDECPLPVGCRTAGAVATLRST
jgi:hypothetical protein